MIHSHIIHVIKFVRENQEKRDRAERKITDEIELQNKRTDDIERMGEDLTSISNIKNLMEKRIKEHKLYEVLIFFFLFIYCSCIVSFKSSYSIILRWC